jgi:hypothetical protein
VFWSKGLSITRRSAKFHLFRHFYWRNSFIHLHLLSAKLRFYNFWGGRHFTSRNDLFEMAETPSTTDSGPPSPVLSGQPERDAAERRGAKRFPYPHIQQIAFFMGVKMPSQDAFHPVLCHDISQEGISFFYPTAPEAEQLVISLGSQGQESLVVARVRYHVPAQAAALFDPTAVVGGGYLVGCEFLRRLGY